MDKMQEKLFGILQNVVELASSEFDGQKFDENEAFDIVVSEDEDRIMDFIWAELKSLNPTANEILDYLKNHFSLEKINSLLDYECSDPEIAEYILSCIEEGSIKNIYDVKMILLGMLYRTLIDDTFENPTFLDEVENGVAYQLTHA